MKRRFISGLGCLLVLAMLSTSAWATPGLIVWSGAVDANYSDAGNWTVVDANFVADPNEAARVPSSIAGTRDEQVYIYNGGSSTLSGSSTINQMTVGGPAIYTTPGDPNSSLVAYGPSSLTIASGAALSLNSDGGGYVDNSGNPVPYPATFTVGGTYGGTLNVNGGVIIQSRGTVIEPVLGTFVTIPNFTVGNNIGNTDHPAVLNITGGSIGSANRIEIGYGSGTDACSLPNLSKAIVNQSGGTLSAQNEIRIAHNGGQAIYNMTGGTLQTKAISSLGGTWSNCNISVGTRYGAATFSQSGGLVDAGYRFHIAGGGGNATYNLSGGVLKIGSDSSSQGASGNQNCNIGRYYSGSSGTTSLAQAGHGVFNMSGGSLILGNYRSLSLGVGKAPGDANVSEGEFNMTGGYFYVSPSTDHGIKLCDGDTGSTLGHGVMTILGGTLQSETAIKFTGNLGGTLKVGPNAVVNCSNLQMWDGTNTSHQVAILFDSAGRNGVVGGWTNVNFSTIGVDANARHSLYLATGNYRPKEGAVFTIMDGFGGQYGDRFSTLVSDITIGVAKDANGNDLPIWEKQTTGNKFVGQIVQDFNSGKYKYTVAFWGLTAGDANGDHQVGTGDLALLGGGWNKAGTWATGDFNGDGQVGTGDLSLLGGNWNWVKPASAPEVGGTVPEPATMSLLVLGGLSLLRRKKC